MDIYGIGAAVHGAARIYFQSARASGRTTALINILEDGDRVIFADTREADRVKSLCRERGKDIRCVTVDPRDETRLFDLAGNKVRTYLDHSFVEKSHLLAIEACEKRLGGIQTLLSGGNGPKEDSEQAKKEHIKWRMV